MEPQFPGIRAIADGSEVVAPVEVRITDGACVCPITPSTHMATVYQAAVADGVLADKSFQGALRALQAEAQPPPRNWG